MAMCPATGEPHTYEQTSDEINGDYVKCSECPAGWSDPPPISPRAYRAPGPTSVFDQPDEWSMR